MIITTKELSYKELPMFNETGFFPSDEYSATQPYSYSELVKLIKKTPEAIGILRAIQTDICSDGYMFEGAKVRVDAAVKFCKENQFKTEFQATVFDWELFGNGALWKGKIDKSRIKEAVDKIQAITKYELKETEIKQLFDEEANKLKLLKCAPWSTMNIEMGVDKTTISGYHQIVNGERTIPFTPQEIIHAKFMQFDGKVYGFSPMESCINVITTLSLIKDLNGNFFQNGGTPDWMFILPKEMAGSPNVQKLELVLAKYKSARNKHGNLVFTGEVTPIALNKFDKDMEFRQLAIYYTGILALAFNMPIARVAAIIGGEIKGGAADTDLSEAGYWRSISSAQDYWEDLLNSQLFEPEFGVSIKFNRGYKNDEIKEAQRDVQMFEVLNNLAKAGSIKPEYIKLKLHIPDNYWTGTFNPVETKPSFGSPSGSKGSVNEDDTKGLARQEYSKQKKSEAEQAQER